MPRGQFVCDACGQLVVTKEHPCKPNRVTLLDATFFESNSILRRKMIQKDDKLEKLETGFRGLLEAARKAAEAPKKASRIMTEALKEVEKGGLQFDPVIRRRLDDGERAMKLPLPKTKDEAVKFLDAVHQGAVALQSLDDLGIELNKKAGVYMDELGRRAKKVKKKFKLG